MHVTVGICTRDRGDSVARTLRSILRSDYEDFDIIVVDQSACDDTARAVREVAGADSRIMYIHSPSTGASAARNVSISNAKGPIVTFTDDDCEVSPNWLGLMGAYFRDNPDVGQICGAVLPGPHDSGLGFIPDAPISRVKRISSPWLKWRERGISANMGFRLTALRAVGPFDEVLGPGAPLYACEDGDITFRMLEAGYTVLSVPDAYVVHHGFRTWAQGQPFMRRTGVAIGAMHMKHLRIGDIAVLPTFLIEWMRCISWRRLLTLRRYNGLARFAMFGLGCIISYQFSVDRQRRIYSTKRRLPWQHS